MTITPPATLTARCPEDILAAVPVVLGFVPHESVVMLTFGAERTFHARVDLPGDPAEFAEMVSALLEPARRHRVRRVLFVVYSEDASLAGRVTRSLVRPFERSGIAVIEALRADGSRWFALQGGRRGVPEWGVPYDVSAHAFLAQSVLDGQVTHGSRSDLAATLLSDRDGVAAVTGALGASAAVQPNDSDEGAWACARVRHHLAGGTTPDAVETARLLSGLLDLVVRDAVCSLMGRDDARDHIRLWTDIVRRAPIPMLAAPAALLGFAAWLAGHGALAWCAIDRCQDSDPDYRMAGYLAQTLTQAIPPSVWEGPY